MVMLGDLLNDSLARLGDQDDVELVASLLLVSNSTYVKQDKHIALLLNMLCYSN